MNKKIQLSFKSTFDNARDRVISNVAESCAKKNIKIEPRDLKSLLSIIDASFDQAYVTAVPIMERAISES